MANILTSNPYVIDTAATIWPTATNKGTNRVRLIQWIDDNADIADDDDLVLTINGVAVTAKVQLTNNTANTPTIYEIGPFNPGIPVTSFEVTTIDHGILVVWVD